MSNRPTLDQATARAVRAALTQLQLGSLYEFLSLPRAAHVADLYNEADARYRELRSMGGSDADTNTMQELAGHAMAVFAGVEAKERYDNTLDQEAMAEFDGHLEVIGRDAYLEATEIAALVRRAADKGVPESVARGYILDYGARRKWGLESRSTPPRAGHGAVEECPNCERELPGEDAFCGFCGCSRQVRLLLKDAARLLENGEVKNAEACFKRAESLDEGSGAASRALARFEELGSRISRVQQLKEDRLGMAAAGALAELEADLGSWGTSQLAREIAISIGAAWNAYYIGEKHRGAEQIPEARHKFEEALGYCADFPGAMQALEEAPEVLDERQGLPSVNLRVRVAKGGVHLRWKVLLPPVVPTFEVRRGRSRPPRTRDEGSSVTQTQECECWDYVPQEPEFYYSVFVVVGSRVVAWGCRGPFRQRETA